MFDLLWLEEISPILVFAGIIIDAATLLGICYFLRIHLKEYNSYKIYLISNESKKEPTIQKLFNECNDFTTWLAICSRRKESPDDEPSFVFLENVKSFLFQGGQKWKINQIILYPSFVRDLSY